MTSWRLKKVFIAALFLLLVKLWPLTLFLLALPVFALAHGAGATAGENGWPLDPLWWGSAAIILAAAVSIIFRNSMTETGKKIAFAVIAAATVLVPGYLV